MKKLVESSKKENLELKKREKQWVWKPKEIINKIEKEPNKVVPSQNIS
jgi:hypothetical protein